MSTTGEHLTSAADDELVDRVHTYEPDEDGESLAELEGEERRDAVRRAAARLMSQNRDLMDRLSRR